MPTSSMLLLHCVYLLYASLPPSLSLLFFWRPSRTTCLLHGHDKYHGRPSGRTSSGPGSFKPYPTRTVPCIYAREAQSQLPRTSSPRLRCGRCCHLPNTESGGARRLLRSTHLLNADTMITLSAFKWLLGSRTTPFERHLRALRSVRAGATFSGAAYSRVGLGGKQATSCASATDTQRTPVHALAGLGGDSTTVALRRVRQAPRPVPVLQGRGAAGVTISPSWSLEGGGRVQRWRDKTAKAAFPSTYDTSCARSAAYSAPPCTHASPLPWLPCPCACCRCASANTARGY
jgi:hypothetical protein